MTCLTPVKGFRSDPFRRKSNSPFTKYVGYAMYRDGKPISMSTRCHHCEGCRFDASREMAVRIQHEASMYDNGLNCAFVTLTYKDEFVPPLGALDYFGDWESFFKRIREDLRLKGIFIRYYMIGEYGDLNLRPHYHFIVFGFNFPDKYEFIGQDGKRYFRSSYLESFWTVPRGKPMAGESLGYSTVGDVTFASAAYVARYCMKKVIGNSFIDLSDYYDSDGVCIPKRLLRFHPETGEPFAVPRERPLMSKKPGIGKAWFDQFAIHDLYVKDFIHGKDGSIIRAPGYYDRLLKRCDEKLFDSIKRKRQDYHRKHVASLTQYDLDARRALLLSKLSKSQRSL